MDLIRTGTNLLIVLWCGIVAITCALVLTRWIKMRRERGIEQKLDALRRDLVELLMADDFSERLGPYLRDLDPDRGLGLGRISARLLEKLQGEPRDRLVLVLASLGAFERAVAGLRSRTVVERALWSELLARARLADPVVVAALLGALHDRSPEVRTNVAYGLIASPTDEVVRTLLDSAANPIRGVNSVLICDVIRQMGPQVLPLMREAIRSPRVTDQLIGAEVLGLHRDRDSVPYLAALAVSPYADALARILATWALGLIGHPHAITALDTCLGVRMPTQLRRVAALARGMIGGPGAVAVLGPLLASRDLELARMASLGLSAAGVETTSYLAELVADPRTDPQVAGFAALALGSTGQQLDRSLIPFGRAMAEALG